MTITLQSMDVTETTDANGYLNDTFANVCDQVLATANSPMTQAEATAEGTTPVVSAVARLGADGKAINCRVWQRDTLTGSGIKPAANVQVRVTFLGITH